MEDLNGKSPPVQDSAARASSSQPSSTKISCLTCRAAKRKCHTPDALTVCRRCAINNLICEYQQHHRGRRKKRISPTPSAPPLPPPSLDATVGIEEVISQKRSESGGPVVDKTQLPAHHGGINIHFSHLVPVDGDSSPYLPRGIPAPMPTGLERLLRSDSPDPVIAGVITELEASSLFDYYFRHLNITVPILDPVLHTFLSCRERSPLLFTAVLTVTSKVRQPKAYSHCLLLANKLVGQMMEHGLCSVEIVQALNMLTHWKKADDGTSWRRVGYAIRMSQELKLHERAPRPLPTDEVQAREILNRERAWLNLIVADYHLAIHHSLPRMITEEGVDDPADWVDEHAYLPCIGESSLGPMITFSRMCRLYADMLEGMNDSQSSLRLLRWCESEWKRWRAKWIIQNDKYDFLQQQLSTFKLCDAYFRFHLAEARLLYRVRYGRDRLSFESDPDNISLAFQECVEASLTVAEIFQRDFVHHGYLPYCFNLVWVGLTVTSVWLIKNIIPMGTEDRTRVLRVLSEIQASTEEASCSSDDMAAHTHRILKHLLSGIPPEWQFTSMLGKRAPDHTSTASLVESTSSLNTNTAWDMHGSQSLPQDEMWGLHGGTGFDIGDALLSLNTPSILDAAHDVDMQGVTGDMLLPPVDADFWRSLFPPNGIGML